MYHLIPCYLPLTYSQLYPPILLLDEVYECHALEQILDAASALSKRPYIIATLCSGNTKGIPLHQLLFHHQIRYDNTPILPLLSLPSLPTHPSLPHIAG